jgi:hypothetical protein
LLVDPSIEREIFLATSHAIIFVDSEPIGLEPRNVVVMFNKISDIFDFTIAVAVDESEPFDLVINSLASKFS